MQTKRKWWQILWIFASGKKCLQCWTKSAPITYWHTCSVFLHVYIRMCKCKHWILVISCPRSPAFVSADKALRKLEYVCNVPVINSWIQGIGTSGITCITRSTEIWHTRICLNSLRSCLAYHSLWDEVLDQNPLPDIWNMNWGNMSVNSLHNKILRNSLTLIHLRNINALPIHFHLK